MDHKPMQNRKICFMLVVVLIISACFCFVACGALDKMYIKRLSSKGYSVEEISPENLGEYMEDEVEGAEWVLVGTIGDVRNDDESEFVLVIGCNSKSSAENNESALKASAAKEGLSVARSGKFIILGTEKGVIDAQNNY